MSTAANPRNMHESWRPVHRLCQVCSFDFDYVIKFESLAEETLAFGKRIGYGDQG